MTGGYRPGYVVMDTPEGRLSVSWPHDQLVYDGLEVVAELPPQDPEPVALLDGKPVSMDRARQIARDAAGVPAVSR